MSKKPGPREIEELAVAKADARIRQMECNARQLDMLFKAEAAGIRTEMKQLFSVRTTALLDELQKTLDDRLLDLLTRKLGEEAARYWQESDDLPAIRATPAVRNEFIEEIEVIRQEMNDLSAVRYTAMKDELMTILDNRIKTLLTKYKTIMDSIDLGAPLPKSLWATS